MEMTVRAALSKKKMLDKQINSTMCGEFFAIVTPNTRFIDGLPKKSWETKAKERFQSLNDKIKYRDALNVAIMQANTTNLVELPVFDGLSVPKGTKKKDKISFAAAIARKTYIINLLDGVNTLIANLRDGSASYARQVRDAEQIARDRMKDEYANTAVSVSSSERNKREEEMLKQLLPEFVDPNKLADSLYDLKEYFEAYLTEIDSALGHATEVTMVTVPEV